MTTNTYMLVLLRDYWEIAEITGNYRRLLEIAEITGHWRLLEITENHWSLLEITVYRRSASLYPVKNGISCVTRHSCGGARK